MNSWKKATTLSWPPERSPRGSASSGARWSARYFRGEWNRANGVGRQECEALMACRWRRLCVLAFSLSLFASIALSGVIVYAQERQDDASMEKELENLRSKVAILESSIVEWTHEHKSKDDKIAQLERIIQEKSDNLVSLHSEINSLKKKSYKDTEDRVGKAHAQANELENQVSILKSTIDLQNSQREVVELRASDAEKKAKELNAKIGSLEKLNEEQKDRIVNLERELQSTEKELSKAQAHAETKLKELFEVKAAWLPHWLAVHCVEFQLFAAKKWNTYGEPTWKIASHKALESIGKVQVWAKPHIEKINSTWIPVLKEKYVELCTAIEPHVQTVATRSLEAYGELKTAVSPHLVKAKEMIGPYMEDVKTVSRPYIEQIATSVKPHVDKATIVLEPYTKQAIHVYQKSLKSVDTYHHQVQSSVRRKLEEHELSRPLATEKIVWYLASVLLTLPIIVIYRVYFFLFRRKVQKPIRGSLSNHTSRKHKRKHA